MKFTQKKLNSLNHIWQLILIATFYSHSSSAVIDKEILAYTEGKPLPTQHTLKELFNDIIPKEIFETHILSKIGIDDAPRFAQVGKYPNLSLSEYAASNKFAVKYGFDAFEHQKLIETIKSKKSHENLRYILNNSKHLQTKDLDKYNMFSDDETSELMALKVLLESVDDKELSFSRIKTFSILWESKYTIKKTVEFPSLKTINFPNCPNDFSKILINKEFSPSKWIPKKYLMEFYEYLAEFLPEERYKPSDIMHTIYSNAQLNGWKGIDLFRTAHDAHQMLKKHKIQISGLIIPKLISEIPRSDLPAMEKLIEAIKLRYQELREIFSQ